MLKILTVEPPQNLTAKNCSLLSAKYTVSKKPSLFLKLKLFRLLTTQIHKIKCSNSTERSPIDTI